MNARVNQDQFDEIYRQDVLPALESDAELDFKLHEASEKYLNNGVCPGCGKRSLYISRQKPFQLKCNRLNKCQYEEKTRDRYSYLFENLSDRFPDRRPTRTPPPVPIYSALAGSTLIDLPVVTSKRGTKPRAASGWKPSGSLCATATGNA